MTPPSSDPTRILQRLESQGIQLGLDRPRRLLAALGDPHLRFPAVLVAGSNGKGSTAALLAAMATAAGHRVGLYTSPHLETPEEEIVVAGHPIAPRRLGKHLSRVLAASGGALGGDPTPFEAMTAAAFLHFAAEEVDLTVLEAGMGGARDATNVAEPILSLITSVSLEHRRWLGETLEAIAREKAGIFRPGRPALVRSAGGSGDIRRVRGVLEREAAARGSRFHWLPEEVRLRAVDPRAAGREVAQRVRLRTPVGVYDLDLALPGRHQAWNLALAVRAAELLAEDGWDRFSAEAITTGAAACRWPGRLEERRLPGGTRVLLDGAHNPEAAAALADHLQGLGEPFDLLFGVLTDKDAGEMLARLVPASGRLTLTRPPGSRGRDPAELLALLPARRSVIAEKDPLIALETALAPRPRLLVVCGSLALVGWVRGRLRR